MVRNYDPDRPVPHAVVERVLHNAIRAPSAGFSQGWGFLVVRDPADRARFWAAGSGSDPTGPAAEPDSWLRAMRRAPVLILCCSNKRTYLERYAEDDKGWTDQDEARWPVPYWDIDTGMAALLMLLTAVDAELGACFFGVPVEHTDAVTAAFDVPADYRPIGVVSLGYPAHDRPGSTARRGRRADTDVLFEGRWGRPIDSPTG